MNPKIQHLIVLVLENRSFDHLLGYLDYPPEAGFEGLRGREYDFGNPVGDGTQTVFPAPTAGYVIEPGPDHSHEGVMTQLFGLDWLTAAGDEPTNRGFALDYGRLVGADPARVMECFTPDHLQVISRLAKEFAVCDHWFCSVPGETWPNRNFIHAATSDGTVDIKTRLYDNRTIFENLTQAERDWAIYYHGFPPQSFAFSALWARGQSPLRPSWFQRFKPIANLYRAIHLDHLPQYAFIEPDMLGSISDSQHPEMGGERDFRAGELLIWIIYKTLRQNPQVFQKTLFLVTYDEHGGFFDHVHPPHGSEWKVCQLPDGKAFTYQEPGYMFEFDLLGLRVPAILISPWIKKGTLDHNTYDHASIPATVRTLFGTSGPLTTRDEHARSFDGILNLEKPRSRLPVIKKPVVDPPRRPEPRQLKLSDSLFDLLRDQVWEMIRQQPGDFLRRLLKHPTGIGEAGPSRAASLPEEVSQQVLADLGDSLSPAARQVLAGPLAPPETWFPAQPSPENGTPPEPQRGFGDQISMVTEILRRKVEGLENFRLVDDAQVLVEWLLHKYYQDSNFILRTADERTILQPGETDIRQAIERLYSHHVEGQRVWLADEMDRWLTIHADRRLTWDDIQPEQSVELTGIAEETAIQAFLDMRRRQLNTHDLARTHG
jgi:phospholipase C